jgi:hypothetical protein
MDVAINMAPSGKSDGRCTLEKFSLGDNTAAAESTQSHSNQVHTFIIDIRALGAIKVVA